VRTVLGIAFLFYSLIAKNMRPGLWLRADILPPVRSASGRSAVAAVGRKKPVGDPANLRQF
jgi:hypothetical protein